MNPANGKRQRANTITATPVEPALGEPPEWFALKRACWLSPGALLVAGRSAIREDKPISVRLGLNGSAKAVSMRSLIVSLPGAPTTFENQIDCLLLLLFETACQTPLTARLILQLDDRIATITVHHLDSVSTDLRTFILEQLAILDVPTRMAILNLCAAAAGENKSDATDLHISLLTLREALRERLPGSVMPESGAPCLTVDHLLRIDDRRFYVKGVLLGGDHRLTHLTALSPEGGSVELLGNLFRYRVDQKSHGNGADGMPGPGFVACFESESPSQADSGWVFQARGGHGLAFEARAPDVISDLTGVRDKVLSDLELDPARSQDLIRRHLHPALRALQERQAKLAAIDSVHQFGTPTTTPRVSVIIPLYHRVDFLEHQLAHFALDAEVCGADVIFVLDSPEQAADLLHWAALLSELYPVPFRVAVLRRNYGFSIANNLGVSLARGEWLLLLNADVFPEKPGWLGKMVAFCDSKPSLGALGVKLLYEDDSLQHAGLYFHRRPPAIMWNNEHYFKGLHRSLPAANLARPVPAVSAACMMLKRDVFAQAGGFRGCYVQGDFEDSDLCLRLGDMGFEVWYLPEAVLYHLEGQSYPSHVRQLTGRYNAWLHTELWNDRIQTLMDNRQLNYAEI